MRRRIGFTLLELLIVVIIIGVLAAIAMTQYTGAIANAKNSYAKSVLGEMRKAAVAYESLNKAWPTAIPIKANLDGVAGDEVSFTASSTDYSFSIAAGVGKATVTGAGTGAECWQITFDTGVIKAFTCS